MLLGWFQNVKTKEVFVYMYADRVILEIHCQLHVYIGQICHWLYANAPVTEEGWTQFVEKCSAEFKEYDV